MQHMLSSFHGFDHTKARISCNRKSVVIRVGQAAKETVGQNKEQRPKEKGEQKVKVHQGKLAAF